MPSIGPMEIVAVAAIALIVFGPDKLPEIARTVGRTLSQLRKMADDVRGEFTDGLNFDADEDDDDSPGPAPRRDHPNVRAGEAAAAGTAAWDRAEGAEEPEDEFDPNFDVEAAEHHPESTPDPAEAAQDPPATSDPAEATPNPAEATPDPAEATPDPAEAGQDAAEGAGDAAEPARDGPATQAPGPGSTDPPSGTDDAAPDPERRAG